MFLADIGDSTVVDVVVWAFAIVLIFVLALVIRHQAKGAERQFAGRPKVRGKTSAADPWIDRRRAR
jgi:hypothetical protein